MDIGFVVFHLLLSWLIAVVLQVFVHFFKIEIMSTRPWYLQWWVIRAFAALLYAMPFGLLGLREWLIVLVFQLSSHFAIFNPLLNKIRQLYWRKKDITIAPRYHTWYLGSNSGWLDRLFIKNLSFYKFTWTLSVVLTIYSSYVIFSIWG